MFGMALTTLRIGGRIVESPFISSVRFVKSAMHGGNHDDVSWNNARSYEEIPGPKPLPIIGSLYYFLKGIGNMNDPEVEFQHRKLLDKYGTIIKFAKIPGYNDIVILFDPKLFEEVYRKEGPWPDRDIFQSLAYYRKIHRRDFFQGVSGILVEREKDWKKFRTKVNAPMMQTNAGERYLKHFVDVSDEFVERVANLRDHTSEMPSYFGNELNKWALESISMIALDKRLGCLEQDLKPDSEPQKMINAVEDLIACMEIMEKGPRIWKIIATPTWRKFSRAMDYLTEVSYKCVTDAIKRMREMNAGGAWEPSVLEKFLLRDSDPKTACVMATDMLVVGIDTTSVTAGNMIYLLSKYQDKQDYLYQETKIFLPNKKDEITLEMMKNMRYLKACIKESMRLLGIDAFNLRETTKNTVIGNYRIPKNVTIMLGHMLCGLMDQYYPEASRYIPERWLRCRPGDEPDSVGSAEDYDIVRYLKAHPFVSLPFGFGPRMCIGKRFAEMELEILMIKMIRHFKIEYTHEDVKYKNKLFIKPVSPLKFKLTDREL